MSIFDQTRALEDLQTLVGSRARGRTQAAVRIDDIAALLEVPPTLSAKKAEDAEVSVAEFNAVVADLTRLHQVLLAVATALQARVRP